MIPRMVNKLAHSILDAAMKNRAARPPGEPITPMLLLYRPRTAVRSSDVNVAAGGLYFIPMTEFVHDELAGFRLLRALVAACNPEAVLFWSETWNVRGHERTEGLMPRDDPKSRDALLMVIQTPDDSLCLTRTFAWKDGAPVFDGIRAGCAVREFSRFADWYPRVEPTRQ